MTGTVVFRALGATCALALGLSLAGCANPIESIVKGGVEKVIGEASGGDVSFDTGSGASLPDGWPDLPVPDKAPSMSIKSENGYSATFAVNAAEAEKVLAAFENDSAYTATNTFDMENLKSATFESNDWNVGLTILIDDESNDVILQYIVSVHEE
ncbi:hypothetical protein [Microbacterium sp. YY-01]|uniref:hypothetical protein n=1 Tax=Microbacterium sp. YY-01 TaxID=3421634 RepID=UPI003D16B972